VRATKKSRVPGRAAQVLVRFTGVEAAALEKLGVKFFTPLKKTTRDDFIEMTALRLVGFALRDVDRSVATWRAFLDYCHAEGFTEAHQKREVQNRQIETAWATSRAAKELRAARR